MTEKEYKIIYDALSSCRTINNYTEHRFYVTEHQYYDKKLVAKALELLNHIT